MCLITKVSRRARTTKMRRRKRAEGGRQSALQNAGKYYVRSYFVTFFPNHEPRAAFTRQIRLHYMPSGFKKCLHKKTENNSTSKTDFANSFFIKNPYSHIYPVEGKISMKRDMK